LSMAVGEYVSVSTQRDAEEVLGVAERHLTNPMSAAFASGASFVSGAIIPLLAVVLPTGQLRLPVTFVAVLVVLFITGYLSAHAGGANKTKAVVRVVVGGIIAMAITYGIGKAFGVVGI
jgi:VIT1/CCC1 family predicted Fe2+/Mn2+ transporter